MNLREHIARAHLLSVFTWNSLRLLDNYFSIESLLFDNVRANRSECGRLSVNISV